MVSRRLYRIPVELEAELILNSKRYEGVIENISEEGVYMKIPSEKMPADLAPGSELELEFELPSDETLTLNCKLMWSDNTQPDSSSNNIGLEITDLPQEYEDFHKELYIKHMGVF